VLEAGLHLDRDLDGEEAEERRELDDRVQRDRGGVLEGVADRVADDRRGVEGVPFCFSSTSTIFFALSQAPPALAMKMAWKRPKNAMPIR
jgi:hypothetical protein